MESISFVESLKELMIEFKVSVSQLAAMIRCDKAAIRRWLYGMYLPDPLTVIKLADAFGVSADYLFGFTDNKAFTRYEQKSTFYERYKNLKEAHGDTDYTVSKNCAIRDSAISKWKTIKDYPSTDSLLKLVNYFHCSMDYLLGRGNS